MALPSSSFSYTFKYDVFLSFRGSDTRYGFTGNLWKALCEKGIHTFIDDKELERGSQITPSLVEAIKESRIAIVVLSNNYASSSFCLDELVNILEHIKENDRLVLPIFYDVDPSHVRHHTASYGEALADHEATFNDNKENLKDNMQRLQKWKIALHKVANLSGAHFKLGNQYEHKFIRKIVNQISARINFVPLHVADYPVGMESKIQQVKKLLDVGSDKGAHMVGIYGIGGVGKTTLARAVYNSISDNFKRLCFLHNVRETSVKHGLVHLQENLLYKTLGLTVKLGDVNEGIPIIEERLKIKKKVLLILDDVDSLKQLQVLAGRPDWFSPNSRIIITTRDQHLLARHGVTRTYEVPGLNVNESLELFRWNAFKSNNVDLSYDCILNRAITYASGLPLALEVIGSNLHGKSIEECESALDRYKRIPHQEIEKILKVSFDTLEEEEQCIFLDIACCFKGYRLTDVEYILNAHHENNMKHHIRALVEKSLIKIYGSRVTLHDLIEGMGKEIVRLESPKEPGKRSRLWHHKDIIEVLEENTGTGKIEIVHLDFPLEEVEWDGEAFKQMKNLRTLIIRNGKFSEAPKYLPSSLRVLELQGCPSEFLPSSFHPKKLVACKLSNNCFKSSELACFLRKEFVNLKVINFDECGYLTEIPDVSCLSNLEEISFSCCENLISIHDSIGFLNKLKILKASFCSKLKSFPPIKLISLEKLNLSFCGMLENFPEILGKMEKITNLVLGHTAIKDLPLSFLYLTRLQSLHVINCGIVWLPRNVLMMPEFAEIINGGGGCVLLKQNEGEEKPVNSVVFPSEEVLVLSSCNLTNEYLPVVLTQYANVKTLNLSDNIFTNVPECIKECQFLRMLILDGCKQLEEIRGIPPNLKYCSALGCDSFTSSCKNMLLNEILHEDRIRFLNLPLERIPQGFKHQSRGRSISFWFLHKFPAITLCFINQWMPKKYSTGSVRLTLVIDGTMFDEVICGAEPGQTGYFIDLKTRLVDRRMRSLLFVNNWTSVKVIFNVEHGMSIIESGIYVFKDKYVQFTDPHGKRNLNDDGDICISQNHQLLRRHRSL